MFSPFTPARHIPRVGPPIAFVLTLWVVAACGGESTTDSPTGNMAIDAMVMDIDRSPDTSTKDVPAEVDTAPGVDRTDEFYSKNGISIYLKYSGVTHVSRE